ncbi:helix-turn-helix transcriptional regulator [Embleya sp. NPDC055664]
MSASEEDFEARVSHLPEYLTRAHIRALTGRGQATVANWTTLPDFPAPVRSEPGTAHLYRRDEIVAWCRAQAYGGNPSPGPEPARTEPGLRHTPNERLTIAEIGARRGYKGTKPAAAVHHLVKTYADHPEHPFPPAGSDRKRDATAVAAWFTWYDLERPGKAKQVAGRARAEREALVESIVDTTVREEHDLTAADLAERLNITERVALGYLNELAPAVLRRHGLIGRRDIPLLLNGDRERAKALLRRSDAPRPVLLVGKTDYYRDEDIDRLLADE